MVEKTGFGVRRLELSSWLCEVGKSLTFSVPQSPRLYDGDGNAAPVTEVYGKSSQILLLYNFNPF